MITGGQTTVATRIVYLGTVRVFSAHIYVFRCRHTIWAIKQNLIKKGKSTSMLYFLNKRSHLFEVILEFDEAYGMFLINFKAQQRSQARDYLVT